jgi:hypothetical protein
MKSEIQNVKTREQHESGLSQRRFGTILFLFKLAGIPLGTHPVPRIQIVYNITIALCHYFTYVSCVMDIYVNRNNLEELVKSIRLGLSMTFVTVLDLFFRYLTLRSTLMNCIPVNYNNGVWNVRNLTEVMCIQMQRREVGQSTHFTQEYTASNFIVQG